MLIEFQPNSFEIGFMPTNLRYVIRNLEIVSPPASFIEISIQDEKASKFLNQLKELKKMGLIELLDQKSVFIVLHGEGEMDGKRRIRFCHPDPDERCSYIKFISELYSTIIDLTNNSVTSIVLHPDIRRSGISKQNQLDLLVKSLLDLSDNLPDITILLESRGSKLPRVVQPSYLDILGLDNRIKELGGDQKISHCFDVAQSFIFNGFEGTKELLRKLKDAKIKISEFHISDVSLSSLGHPLVAKELGYGLIHWEKLIDLLCNGNRILFEIFGGVNCFRRSYDYLLELVSTNNFEDLSLRKSEMRSTSNISLENDLIKNKSTSPQYFFLKNKNSLYRNSPGVKKLIELCYERDFYPQSILDLGCGNGRNSLAIAREFGSEINLIDKEGDFVRIATNLLRNHECKIKRVITKPIEEFGIEDLPKFDIVLINYVLQNIHPKYYDKILTLIHHWTKVFALIEIYQNPLIYSHGCITIKKDVSWYGFRVGEFSKLVNTRFKSEWEFNTNTSIKNSSFTSSIIATPLPESKLQNWVFNERKISIVKSPLRRDRKHKITDYKRSSIGFQQPKRALKPQLSRRFRLIDFSKNKIPSSDHLKLKKLYPVCQSCDSSYCDANTCDKMKKWLEYVKSTPNEGFLTVKRKMKKKSEEEFSTLSECILNDLQRNLESLKDSYPSIVKLSLPSQVFITSRVKGIPISLSEICKNFNGTKNRVFKEISRYKKQNEMFPSFTHISFDNYLKRFSNENYFDPEIETEVNILIEMIKSNGLCNGSPIALAAGIWRLAALRSSINIPISFISRITGVSEVTIRNKIKQLLVLKDYNSRKDSILSKAES